MSDQFDPFDSSSSEDDFFIAKLQDIEAQKDRCRSVPGLKPIYNDLLKQAIKQNRNAGIYFKSKYYAQLKKEKTLTQRLYRVQRRREFVKDYSSLLVDYGRGLSDRDNIKNFRHMIQYLRKLRIRLYEDSDPEMMANWIKVFQGKHLPKLKDLVLDPSNADIFRAREGQFPLFRSKCSNVDNLKISFSQMQGIRDISIGDFTLRLIRGIRKLKHLRFDVVVCGFADEHLCVIGRALRSRLRHLESLEMRFAALSSHITTKEVVNLWKSLDKIHNLKKLELSGDYSHGVDGDSVIDYEAFTILCDVIQRKSATLTTLKLDMGSSKLGYDAHKYLSQTLVNLLPRLEQIELKFSGRESTSDDSLPLLGDLLSNGSGSLKTLTLDFYGCSNITSKGAEEFAEKLKKGSFPAVEKLWLSFRYMPKLRFEGLYAIAEAVSVAFLNVKDLTFKTSLSHNRYYDDNYELNDNGIQTKAETMLKEKLKKLPKRFRLDWSE